MPFKIESYNRLGPLVEFHAGPSGGINNHKAAFRVEDFSLLSGLHGDATFLHLASRKTLGHCRPGISPSLP